MRRHADGQRVETGAGEQIDRATRAPRQHQGQRPGPKRGRQARGDFTCLDVVERRFGVGEVTDQRVEVRPALGLEDRGNRTAVGGVGAKPVDGFSTERDQTAVAEEASGGGDACRVGRDDGRHTALAGAPRQTKPGLAQPGFS